MKGNHQKPRRRTFHWGSVQKCIASAYYIGGAWGTPESGSTETVGSESVEIRYVKPDTTAPVSKGSFPLFFFFLRFKHVDVFFSEPRIATASHGSPQSVTTTCRKCFLLVLKVAVRYHCHCGRLSGMNSNVANILYNNIIQDGLCRYGWC